MLGAERLLSRRDRRPRRRPGGCTERGQGLSSGQNHGGRVGGRGSGLGVRKRKAGLSSLAEELPQVPSVWPSGREPGGARSGEDKEFREGLREWGAGRYLGAGVCMPGLSVLPGQEWHGPAGGGTATAKSPRCDRAQGVSVTSSSPRAVGSHGRHLREERIWKQVWERRQGYLEGGPAGPNKK